MLSQHPCLDTLLFIGIAQQEALVVIMQWDCPCGDWVRDALHMLRDARHSFNKKKVVDYAVATFDQPRSCNPFAHVLLLKLE